MISVYVLRHRESRELYKEVYVDVSMMRTPVFNSFDEGECFRKSLSDGGYYETIKLRITERRYNELQGTH